MIIGDFLACFCKQLEKPGIVASIFQEREAGAPLLGRQEETFGNVEPGEKKTPVRP